MDPEALSAFINSMSPAELAAFLSAQPSGFDAHIGLRYTHAAADLVTAELMVSAQHTQPYGLVHGGVYCAVAEAICTVGAALTVVHHGRSAVGIRNETRFHRAARAGTQLLFEAKPTSSTSSEQTWTATARSEDHGPHASTTVVVRILDPGAVVGGDQVELQTSLPT